MDTKITYEIIRKTMRGDIKRSEKSFRIVSYFRKIRIFVYLILFVYPYSPVLVFAAALKTPTNLTEFVNNFNTILYPIIMFVAALGFFGFLTGVLKYVGAGGDEERLGKAKQLIAYGLVGMLIMFTFWGIAKILSASYLTVGL